MNIISFNYWDLVGPHKRSTLKRVVGLEHPDILLLQENLGVGEVVKYRLESWFPGWIFETVDVSGCSRGMEIGWSERNVKDLNLCGMESVPGLNLKDLELVVSFTIFNIYGPYLNRIPF